MPNLHIIATGPTGSGKSLLVRHLAANLPAGYRLKSMNAIEGAKQTEYWALVIEKVKVKKVNK